MTGGPLTKYRISKYKHGGWMIEQGLVVKKGKDQGKLRWTPWAYPGNLRQTAERLHDAAISEHFASEEVSYLIEEVKSALERVLDALEAKSDPEFSMEIDLPDTDLLDEPHWSENPYE